MIGYREKERIVNGDFSSPFGQLECTMYCYFLGEASRVGSDGGRGIFFFLLKLFFNPRLGNCFIG